MGKIDVALLTAPVHRNLSVIITLCNKAQTAKRELVVTGEDPVTVRHTYRGILRTYVHSDAGRVTEDEIRFGIRKLQQ